MTKSPSDATIIECKVIKRTGNSYELHVAGKEKVLISGIIAGKIKNVRLVPGDRVNVLLSGYFTKNNVPVGRIIKKFF